MVRRITNADANFDREFTNLVTDEVVDRYAGDYLDAKLEELITKAKRSLPYTEYGEKEALAEQARNLKDYDETTYGGERPFLVFEMIKDGNRSRTAEQKRNRDLIMEGKLPGPKSVPYDSFEGKTMRDDPSRLGIVGRFRDDSEVRGHTTFGDSLDPLLDDSLRDNPGARSINRTGVYTEMLSNEGLSELYRRWGQQNAQETRFKVETSPIQFNRFLAEYYGQQGLKLSGRSAVSDTDRSSQSREAKSRNKPTTVGTDRIIEVSPTFLDPEVPGNPKDYRYYDQNGNVTVGDSQTITGTTNNMFVPLELMNKSNMSSEQVAKLDANLRRKATNLRSVSPNSRISQSIQGLIAEGELPGMKRSAGAVIRDGGMRIGKALSDSVALAGPKPTIGVEDHQFRASEILYSQLPPEAATRLGVRPNDMLLVDLDKTDQMLGDPRYLNKIKRYSTDDGGKFYANVDKNQLIQENAAQELLSRALMNQLK